MSQEALAIARSASETAAQFAELLATRYGDIANALRNGDDAPALDALGASTDEVEQFLIFLIFAADLVQRNDAEFAQTLRGYHRRLMTIFETLGPALKDMDLVEVADTLEHDVVTSLNEYRELDDGVQGALKAA
ncbi:MAG: hypothetical protein B7733_09700 [Myxococcales bacterium FL481]|nr:MAG: hypothetical protein B7733_09700 [Myxococcales bacterium FL481]